MSETVTSGMPANINSDVIDLIERAVVHFGTAFNDLHWALLNNRHDRRRLAERVSLAITDLDNARDKLVAAERLATAPAPGDRDTGAEHR